MGRGTGWEATRTGGNAGVGVGGNADKGGGQTRRTDEASDEAGGNRRNLSVTEVCLELVFYFYNITSCTSVSNPHQFELPQTTIKQAAVCG